METRELKKYHGKAVDFGNMHGPASGIVYNNICYRLDFPHLNARKRMIVKLIPEPIFALDYVHERREELTTPLEKAILEALKNNDETAVLKFEIKKLEFGQR